MDHADLVSEMPQVERLLTQDRLQLARMRRVQQLKVAKQREKEWEKTQSRKDRGGSNGSGKNGVSAKKHILFQDSVVLLEAAARNDIKEVARLLQKGVSPDATNDDGLTALHQCCIDNNPEMLKLLLDYGANVNAEDSERWTPLHAAATCGHIYLVKLLISRAANLLAVNADGNMPYDLCDNEETLDYIEAEMSQRGVTQDLIDETRASTESKMLYDLKTIAARGGDLEAEDHQGATPLHIGAANGFIHVVEFLLENNVSVDAVDNDLWTPVHAAACWGHLEVLEMLVQSGADLNAKNKNEETPADICEDPEIREKIEELRTEQESKRLAEAKKRVKRSQSNNTRAQSVRRTSIRDKTLTTKKDAVEETKLRLQAQEGYATDGNNTTEPNSISSEANQNVVDGQSTTNTTSRKTSNTTPNNTATSNVPTTNTTNNNNNNNASNNNNNSNFVNNNHITNSNNPSNNNNNNNSFHQNQNPLYNNHNHYEGLNRRSPEGKDNDSYVAEENSNKKLVPIGNSNNNNNNNNTMVHKTGSSDIQTGIFQATQENGKINVQVTVLVDTQTMDHSIAGTLADLKKHRAQTRSSSSPENGSIITAPIELSVVSSPELQSPAMHMSKFTGITGDVVSDSTRSRKCCTLM